MPQVPTSFVGQRPSAVPLATETHDPTCPYRLHDWQAPVQSELQQTPCAQYAWPPGPDWHSLALLQDAPIGLRPHEPFSQEFGVTHWELCVQAS